MIRNLLFALFQKVIFFSLPNEVMIGISIAEWSIKVLLTRSLGARTIFAETCSQATVTASLVGADLSRSPPIYRPSVAIQMKE